MREIVDKLKEIIDMMPEEEGFVFAYDCAEGINIGGAGNKVQKRGLAELLLDSVKEISRSRGDLAEAMIGRPGTPLTDILKG